MTFKSASLDAHEPKPSRILKWLFLWAFSYFFVVLFHSHWAPAEIGTRGAMKMIAPTLGAFYEAANRDKISLVLFHDEDLETFGEPSWPARYVFHADNLRAIAAKSPKAIFVDLLFVDKRQDQIEPLITALCETRKRGIRVYLASSASGTGLGDILPTITKSGCATLVSVPRTDDEFDKMIWEYGPETGGGSTPYTAASQIAKDFGVPSVPERGEKLAIIWGTDAAPHNIKSLPEEFCEINSLGKWAKSSTPFLFADSKPYCPFHPLLRVSDVRLNSADPAITGLISGKIVIYGSNIAGSADKVNTALHEKLPGPFVHAMALDNLLTFGQHWKRVVHYDFWHLRWANIWLLMALAFICLLQVCVINKENVRKWFHLEQHLEVALPSSVQKSNVELTGLRKYDMATRQHNGEATPELRKDDSNGKKIWRAAGGLALRAWLGFCFFSPALVVGAIVAACFYCVFNFAPSMWVTIALFPALLENFEVYEALIVPILEDFQGYEEVEH